ncbi:hypothetical protein ASPWEDRAFT_35683 [Aspergillus wentii DTO 134E9]|uniref:Uncharacterized protein n=1 Tax=Aspergillus wentii DTO 134E9 TaxID=1073089 RepID=A0A1L9RTI5_ASPWE|nr:uncharacterized protein ASPWEDRAFT_35683 [Aspergillus wentii DTO 134E9]KAI9933772.1 hypothetical protein MW887_004844 [Aspergillus wentii]OJJ38117.1 hypothetical protein ASPWEDRAFT_35683 [Aspergillus wentii DTO 134E9]
MSEYLHHLCETLYDEMTIKSTKLAQDPLWNSLTTSPTPILQLNPQPDSLFLASLLREYPSLHGGVYGQAQIIEKVRPSFTSHGRFADLSHRVTAENVVIGDLMKGVPVGVYVVVGAGGQGVE